MRARVWRSVWRVVCGVASCTLSMSSCAAFSRCHSPPPKAPLGSRLLRARALSLLWRGRVRYHGRVKINNA